MANQQSDQPECASCGGPLIKRLKLGKINECDQCGRESEKDVRRHVGLVGGAGINKSNVISIWKNPTPGTAQMIQKLNSGKNGANLTLGSTGAEEQYAKRTNFTKENE